MYPGARQHFSSSIGVASQDRQEAILPHELTTETLRKQSSSVSLLVLALTLTRPRAKDEKNMLSGPGAETLNDNSKTRLSPFLGCFIGGALWSWWG
eukprot:5507914-Amphidinium_carterae.1